MRDDGFGFWWNVIGRSEVGKHHFVFRPLDSAALSLLYDSDIQERAFEYMLSPDLIERGESYIRSALHEDVIRDIAYFLANHLEGKSPETIVILGKVSSGIEYVPQGDNYKMSVKVTIGIQ